MNEGIKSLITTNRGEVWGIFSPEAYYCSHIKYETIDTLLNVYNYETVIYLDTDTIIRKDVNTLVEEIRDYDFGLYFEEIDRGLERMQRRYSPIEQMLRSHRKKSLHCTAFVRIHEKRRSSIRFDSTGLRRVRIKHCQKRDRRVLARQSVQFPRGSKIRWNGQCSTRVRIHAVVFRYLCQ